MDRLTDGHDTSTVHGPPLVDSPFAVAMSRSTSGLMTMYIAQTYLIIYMDMGMCCVGTE